MIIAFTDLDGTLLDHNTYSYDESREGMQVLKAQGGELVLVSSKTFDEMSLLHKELSLSSPLIFENGSGIAYFHNKEWEIVLPGSGIESLKKKIPIIEKSISRKILLITDMSDTDLSLMTGLSLERANLSKRRKATLPFIIDNKEQINAEEMEELNKTLKQHNLTVTRGGRFYHLIPGASDKGRAVQKVIAYYARKNIKIESLAFGDSENDIPMLKSADWAYVVRKHGGSVMKHGLKGVTVTAGIGPAGFTEGIRDYFKNRRDQGENI